jgi:hypothetical protein
VLLKRNAPPAFAKFLMKLQLHKIAVELSRDNGEKNGEKQLSMFVLLMFRAEFVARIPPCVNRLSSTIRVVLLMTKNGPDS